MLEGLLNMRKSMQEIDITGFGIGNDNTNRRLRDAIKKMMQSPTTRQKL